MVDSAIAESVFDAAAGELTAADAARSDQLAARQAELEARGRSLQEHLAEWEAAQVEAQRQLDARAAEIEALRTEFETLRADVQAQRETLDAQCRQWEAEQAETQHQLDPRRDEREVRSESVPVSSKPLSTPANEAANEAVEPSQAKVSEEAPVSLADVLRRLGSSVEALDDEAEDREGAQEGGASTGTREEAVPADPAAPASPKGENEEEESMDAYTARWLARVRGMSEAPAAPARRTSSRPQETAESAEAEARSPAAFAPGLPKAAAGELPLRPAGREIPMDLSRMRALANLSASSALNQHARRLRSAAARSKLLIVAVALAAWAAVLWLGGWPALSRTAFYGASACLIVALYWTVQYALLNARSNARSPSADSPSPPPAA
jgi:hypothetical protein